MRHLQVLIGLASLLVAYPSSASLRPLRGHGFPDHQATNRFKRSLEDRLNTDDLALLSAGSEGNFIGKRSANSNAPQSINLETLRVLTRRSAEPVAPYRGHSFRRNSSIRQRPIRTRSRFYRTRGNPNRVSPSG
ncbi:hypothetical protein TCAL_03375 [Tigriopus californicus]|uniref:Uncharacterized protein n=1 Tax=Tigriopus californicus TaxID=6832 RepID=A0A553P1A0_TIGCA|nr:hypothetical protein TCAL_03375 [Tigriopus californicus]|eukprot:TCALIF_03375-PA protein Name:"Protein of unknown function" AED:0.00 eAED:0.00 QI:96/1/1/1/0/0.5/2/157/133